MQLHLLLHLQLHLLSTINDQSSMVQKQTRIILF